MNLKSTLLSLLVSSLILSSPFSHAQNKSKKARDIILSTQTVESPLNVNIHTSKNTYKVDESILLQADSTQDFYLYVFNTGRDGNTTMLVPNAKYTNNFFKANIVHHIPDNIGPAMVGDQAGKESLIIVASATPLTFETGFATKGIYRQATTKEVKKMFRSKDIKWVDRVSEYAPATHAAVNATSTTTINSDNQNTAVTTTNSITQETIANTNTIVNSTTIANSEQTPAAMAINTDTTMLTNTTPTNTESTVVSNNAVATNSTTSHLEIANTSNTASNTTTGSVISAPNLSDNKQVVSYLLEVEIVN